MNTKPQTYGPTIDGDMVPCNGDEWVRLCDYESAEASADKTQELYNAVLDFAIDGSDGEGVLFLRLWREGDWESIRKEFPEFKHLEYSAAPA